jgi:Protein kinase domain
VALYGFNISVDEDFQFLVYEYLVNGALSGFLMDERGRTRLPAQVRISIMFQAARAVHFLHTGGCDNINILHRDIKSGNICLTQDFTAKLIDCGMSKFVTKDKNVLHGESVPPTVLKSSGASVFGTPGYICPDYAQGDVPFTAACDVYSMGIVFAELIVGCLQGGQSSRGGQKFGNFYRRYIHDTKRIDSYADWLIFKDADPSAEWNIHSLKELCEIVLKCMSFSPHDRPTTHELVKEFGKISKADFQNEAGITNDAPMPDNNVTPTLSKGKVDWSSCDFCNESVVETVTCSRMHPTCIPCLEQKIQDIIGHTGDNVCCGIVGCNEPFMDDSLYGKISSFTFKEYVRERGLQRIVDQGFKALRKNHFEVMTSLKEIRSLAQRSLQGLAFLATENVKKCPTLVWMVPAELIVGRTARDWVKWAKSTTSHRRYHVYFVCQHSFSTFDLEPRMEIEVPRSWMVQVAPVLRLSLFAIKSALAALGPLPFPVPDVLPKEQIAMAEELVHSFLDDTTTKLLAAFESACTNGIDIPPTKSSQLMTLTGPAYDGLVEKATKLKRTHWKQHMAPVMNHHGSLIWVKKEYEGFY